MQSCVHSFFFFFFLPDRPTDPPLREEGRWETKHFMGMALTGCPYKVDHAIFVKNTNFIAKKYQTI